MHHLSLSSPCHRDARHLTSWIFWLSQLLHLIYPRRLACRTTSLLLGCVCAPSLFFSWQENYLHALIFPLAVTEERVPLKVHTKTTRTLRLFFTGTGTRTLNPLHLLLDFFTFRRVLAAEFPSTDIECCSVDVSSSGVHRWHINDVLRDSPRHPRRSPSCHAARTRATRRDPRSHP